MSEGGFPNRDFADAHISFSVAPPDSSDLNQRLQKLPANDRPRACSRPIKLWGAVHSKDRDQQAVTYHYDLPTEFYALWLDQRKVYSCAYFATPDEDLDTAQLRKLDYVCRKLRLCPGERLLYIGCGWGGLIVHAAAHYGVEAVGITLSVPQAELARQTLRESGHKRRPIFEASKENPQRRTRHSLEADSSSGGGLETPQAQLASASTSVACRDRGLDCRLDEDSPWCYSSYWYVPSAPELGLPAPHPSLSVPMNEFFNIRSSNGRLFYPYRPAKRGSGAT
jgi:Mycolic acid cyclopropane synthetase